MPVESLTRANLRQAIFCVHSPFVHGDAGERMLRRLEEWLGRGTLRGQVAWTQEGEPSGFVLYYPIEAAPMEMGGEGFYAIQCLFVQPGGWGQGVGRALVEAAIRDAQKQGASGLAVEGFSFPPDEEGFEFMPQNFFRKMGFREVASGGPAALLFLPLGPEAKAPSYLEASFTPPAGGDRLRIDLLNCERCCVSVSNCEAVKQVAGDYSDRVEIHEHDQNSRQAVLEKGMAIGIFMDGELAFYGPPITEEQAREEMERRLTQRASG
ncbi:MAG: GNAT family N-acetyltransferase [Dehalococcoidia bacterium]